MSETNMRASSTEHPFIARRAINSTIDFGVLYDAGNDAFIREIKFQIPMQSNVNNEPPVCSLVQNLFDYIPNLMKKIETRDDFSLFIDLKMIPAEGLNRLINCSHAIDQYTRMISYTWISRTDYLPDYYFDYSTKVSKSNVAGSHVVVLVNHGIDVIFLFQLPRDDQCVQKIDAILQNQCERLNHGQTSTCEEHEEILREIQCIPVLSNIPELQAIESIIEFYGKLDKMKNDISRHQPYNINLFPTNLLFNVNDEEQMPYREISLIIQADIERYLLEMIHRFNSAKALIGQDYSCSRKLIPSFQESLSRDRTLLRLLYQQEIRRLRQWMTRIRTSDIDENESFKSTNLNEKLDELQTKLLGKDEKEKILRDLEYHQFEYRQAKVDEDVEKINDKNIRIVFGTDNLHRQKPDEWNRLKIQWINERVKQPELRLIYVDFTDHQSQPDEFRVSTMPSSDEPVVDDENDVINVVIIGESGVGKSTFINSLVNYLCYDTYQGADTQKPIVLLPISFCLTIGNNFDEQEVKYDGIDPDSNECHSETGSSVTQACRSYLFKIKDSEDRWRKLRLIDTPGSGDVQGTYRDEENRKDILLFIDSLPHLHAVCIVLKPNIDRLTSSFQILLKELIDLLGAEKINDYLLFCFTNTRTTFFAPGNTTKILREVFASLSIPIPLRKDSVFCFDSESFRYLVAKQCGVTPDGDGAELCRDTWDRSSIESKRLLNILWSKSAVDVTTDHHQSIVRARLKIHYLIRPILETVRNELRHIILHDVQLQKTHIDLDPQPIIDNINTYHRCYRDLRQSGKFYMLVDSDEIRHGDCLKDLNSSNERTKLHYCIKYIRKESIASETRETLVANVLSLHQSLTMFSCFLIDHSYNKTSDPIVLQLNQIIHEEEFICQTQSSATLNVLLLKELYSFKTKHIEFVGQLSRPVDLTIIYTLIHDTEENLSIKKQMDAIGISKQYFVRQRQYQVPFFRPGN